MFACTEVGDDQRSKSFIGHVLYGTLGTLVFARIMIMT